MGFGVLGFGFWVWDLGLGFGVWGVGFWVLGLGFGVWGVGVGVGVWDERAREGETKGGRERGPTDAEVGHLDKSL